MKWNIFNSDSPAYHFRWYIITVLVVCLVMVWHDLSGGRIFTSSQKTEWSSSGPGYHK